jgi:hypothetical protein
MFTEKEKKMSHSDPLYSCEDFDMDYNYDDHDAFYGEDSASYHPDAAHEVESQFDDYEDDFDDSMDGDHDSAMESAGWGTDEDYGYFGGEDY